MKNEKEFAMINYYAMVRSFHDAFKIPVSNDPVLLDLKSFARRVRLINEELSEYCKANADGDIVEIADALGDLLYVVFGTCVEHGLPMDEIFEQIHASNMAKIGGHKDSSGKLIKPENYRPTFHSWLMTREK